MLFSLEGLMKTLFGISFMRSCDEMDKEEITNQVMYKANKLSIEGTPTKLFCNLGKLGIVSLDELNSAHKAIHWGDQVS